MTRSIDLKNSQIGRGAQPIADAGPKPQSQIPTVIMEVALERKRQDEKWGGPKYDDKKATITEWLDLIKGHIFWAGTMALLNSWDKVRRRLIQVAALVIATVEWIDRRDDNA